MVNRKRYSRGATLFEILMILFVLSLMVAVAAPALSGVSREKARVGCLQHMKEIVAVGMVYANDDPQNILGAIHPASHSYYGDGYADYGGGPGLAPYVGHSWEFLPRTRPYNRLLFGDGGVPRGSVGEINGPFELFRCTGRDTGWQAVSGMDVDSYRLGSPYFVEYGVSFRMNNLVFDNDLSAGIHGRPINQVPQPGETLAFMEARAFQTVYTNDAWGSLGSLELTGYHDKVGFFNVAYMDGHAATADFGHGTYYPKLPKFDGLSVRGSWGRMDCFPSPILDLDSGWGRSSAGDNSGPVATMTKRGA